MSPVPPKMTDYRKTYAGFGWSLPARFNFAGDVVERLSEEPDRLALIWCNEAGVEERYGFADIARLSGRFANVLKASGIRKGDRVLVMLPRVPQWQIAMVGCLKLGAVAIPCVEMLTEQDLAYRLADSQAKACVTTRRNVAKFGDAGGIPSVRVSVGGGQGWIDYDDAMATADDRFIPAEMGLEDPAVIYYTSGSTGHPKGVSVGARGLYCWRASAWYWLDLEGNDLIWCTADTGWSKAGTSILFGPWSCGAAVFFYDGPFDPEKRLELLARYGVTVFCAAPTELRRLIREDVSAFDLSALRLTVSAGEALDPEIAEKWWAETGVPVLEGYGQTETLMTVVNYPAMPLKPGSMGLPLPGTTVAIVDDEGRPVGPKTPGRLVIKLPNPQLMLGYWNDPKRTAGAVLRNREGEWFVTGDMACIDEEGYVFYLGRADDVINSAGYRIGPAEVENALTQHRAVQECAAVGSPDAERGEVVKAFIVLRPAYEPSDALVRELQEHVKRVTAPYKYPRKIEFVPDLPKTSGGKLRRRTLREREFAQAAMGARS